jgi:HD-like signal output (HDOD) protein
MVHPKHYAEFIERTAEQPCDVLQSERELFGLDHCEVGRRLITSWNLPKEFIEITAHHHDSEPSFDLKAPSLVRHACKFADALGFQAIRPWETKTYEQLLEEIPEPHRQVFKFEPWAMKLSIESKIASFELA